MEGSPVGSFKHIVTMINSALVVINTLV